MKAFEDPNHEGNSSKYHTGKTCIEPNCKEKAGTLWSPYWCFKCNVKRIKSIDNALTNLIASFDSQEDTQQ